jgi:MobA/MobL family
VLVDERTGLVHDYTRRGGVVQTEIVLPDGGSAERNALWNAAEKAENRKDARTAREWVVALPSELDSKQRAELARDFAGRLASRYGVAVDVAIHLPDRDGDQRNHHAHILTTTRQVSCGVDTALLMGEKATIELSDRKRRELGLSAAADEVTTLRKLWEETANGALARAGHDARIDARSLVVQGIDREATTHLGPVATEMERRGVTSDRGDINRQVAANNAEWARLSAEIVELEAERQRREQAQTQTKVNELEQLRHEMLEVAPPGMDVRAAFQDYQRQQEVKKRAEKDAIAEAKRLAEETAKKVALWRDYQEQYHAQKNAEKRAKLEAKAQPMHADEDKRMDLESKEPAAHADCLGQLTMAQLKAEKHRLETWPDPGQMADDDPRFKEAQTKSWSVARELTQLGQSIQRLKDELEDHKAAHSLRTWLHETTLAGRTLMHDRKRMAIEDVERKQEKQLAERQAAWEELEQQNRKLREQLKAEKQNDASREMTSRGPQLEAFNAEIKRREAEADIEQQHDDSQQKSPQLIQPLRTDDDIDLYF